MNFRNNYTQYAYMIIHTLVAERTALYCVLHNLKGIISIEPRLHLWASPPTWEWALEFFSAQLGQESLVSSLLSGSIWHMKRLTLSEC